MGAPRDEPTIDGGVRLRDVAHDAGHRYESCLMARKNTGSVFENVWADGTTIS